MNSRRSARRAMKQQLAGKAKLLVVLALIISVGLNLGMFSAFTQIEHVLEDQEVPLGALPEDLSSDTDLPNAAIDLAYQGAFTTAERLAFDLSNYEAEPEPIEEPEVYNFIHATRLDVNVDSYDPDVDYTTLIDETFKTIVEEKADVETVLALCEIYECKRNLKIVDLALEEQYPVSTIFNIENDLDKIRSIIDPRYYYYTEAELAKVAAVVHAEAGSNWISDEHQRDVASVILNRVESSRFPNTIFEVIYAKGQYPNTCNKTYYTQREYDNAKYVLDNGPTTEGIWQANFKQGNTTLAVYKYPQSSRVTYICK